MLPSTELALIYQKQIRIVEDVANDLYSELSSDAVTPIDTGALREAWNMERTGDTWHISNNMEYASIIFDGRRLVAGQWYGSEWLPGGIDPILMKYNKILEIKLKNVRI